MRLNSLLKPHLPVGQSGRAAGCPTRSSGFATNPSTNQLPIRSLRLPASESAGLEEVRVALLHKILLGPQPVAEAAPPHRGLVDGEDGDDFDEVQPRGVGSAFRITLIFDKNPKGSYLMQRRWDEILVHPELKV